MEEHSGFLRLPDVLKMIPVARSTFWAKVSSGEFPQPLKLKRGGRVTFWRRSDILALCEKIEMENAKNESE